MGCAWGSEGGGGGGRGRGSMGGVRIQREKEEWKVKVMEEAKPPIPPPLLMNESANLLLLCHSPNK